ncbi:unnamed protein product [Hyaloperonospora brassicae]|uniref:RxLR effector candidate protein n=1 Tax=Hyaloperonospora brassicae TaxID=162125 RepID=A0AAV0T610_HYABA|nr:unnamed protein product [Hyaloperonospora brassicae]
MRVFAFALVASSAVLPRLDGASDAAETSRIAHQDPAVVPPTAAGVDSPPSRLLRDQGFEANEAAKLLESATRSLKSSGKVEKVAGAIKKIINAQTELTTEFVMTDAMLRVTRTLEPDDLVKRLVQMNVDEVQLARALYDMQRHSNDRRQHYFAEALGVLMKNWFESGLTKAQLTKNLGLKKRSFSQRVDDEGIPSTGVRMAFYTAVHGGQGPIKFFEDLVAENNGYQNFKTLVDEEVHKHREAGLYFLFDTVLDALDHKPKDSRTIGERKIHDFVLQIAKENFGDEYVRRMRSDVGDGSPLATST